MPCELGVASLSAPHPAFLGVLSSSISGVLTAGLRRVPSRGPHCLRDPLSCSTVPGSFGGRHLLGMGTPGLHRLEATTLPVLARRLNCPPLYVGSGTKMVLTS